MGSQRTRSHQTAAGSSVSRSVNEERPRRPPSLAASPTPTFHTRRAGDAASALPRTARVDEESDAEAKLSLAFIVHSARATQSASRSETVSSAFGQLAVLSRAELERDDVDNCDPTRDPTISRPRLRVQRTSGQSGKAEDVGVSLAASANASRSIAARKKPRAKRGVTSDQKRLARKCSVTDCTNYTINKGLCFKHGGGKKCSTEGCTSSAKVGGLCWKHGGSVQCAVENCERRAKSRGFCWTHGGGTECGHDECTKVAVSKGFCWAHGGGKRCLYDGCNRPAYERTFNYCPKHFERFENGEEIMEV